ncbi:MAG: magnesium transporter [Ardenticatenia bacterium]|nr:magnesium transporter [Ardenticatenia bacterium]
MNEQPQAHRLQRVRALLAAGEVSRLSASLARLHPADVADIITDVEVPHERLTLIRLLPDEMAGEVLSELEPDVAQELMAHMSPERVADILEEIATDDAAEILEDLPNVVREELITLMEPEEAAEVRKLLAYPEESAGRMMTQDVVRLRRRWTVEETLDYLRHLDRSAETIYYLYVVDDSDHLVGVVPLRALVTAPPEATIGQIMTPNVISVRADDDQEDVAELVAKYNFLAVPVVDDAGRLVGIVTVDDVMDVLEEEATEDIQRLGGSEPLDKPYFATPALAIVRKRIGWLLLLFVGGTLTGSVLRHFAHVSTQFSALNIFVPLLIGTGGNAGSQTVATIIRALALGEVRSKEALRVMAREAATGLTIGVVLGTIAFGRAMLWQTGVSVALVVALSLPFITLWASLIGALIPPLGRTGGS